MNDYLLHLLCGITTLLTAALLAGVFLRRRSASLRHSVLAAGMLGILLVPLLLPLLPHRSLGVLPMQRSKSVESIPVPVDFSSDNVMADRETVFVEQEREPMMPSDLAGPATISDRRLNGRLNVVCVLTGLWGIGVGLLLLRFVLSVRAANIIVSKTITLDEPAFGAMAKRLGIKRSIELRQSEVGVVPFTVGMCKPVVVLPESSRHWTVEERRAVLTHELGHVARRDVFWQFLAEFCCAVYWFHPFVWLAARQLRIEREIACDDLVVLAGEEPPVYASILLRLASGLKNRDSRRHLLGCTVAMARHHEVKQRIAAILDTTLLRKPLGRIGTIVLLLAAAVGVLLASTLSPIGKAETPKTETSKTADEIETKKKLAIAVMPDTPLVSLHGKVFLPDGSPAPDCSINVFSAAFTFAERHSSSGEKLSVLMTNTATNTRGTNGITQKDGAFRIENVAFPGANVVIAVNGGDKTKRFVSKPIVFVAQETMEPLKITLEEGIPVRGKIVYENGFPAVRRQLDFEQQVEPISGKDIPAMKEMFRSSRWSRSDDNGDYEIFLTAGDYTVLDRNRKESLSIGSSDEEKKLDWTMATPIYIAVENNDGLPAERVWYSFAGEKGITHVSNGDEIILEPITRDGTLLMKSLDSKWGTVEKITPDMVGKTQRFKLKPMARVTVTLVDSNDRPVVNEPVQLFLQIRNSGNLTSSHGFDTARTDLEGKALLRVFPGKIPVALRLPEAFEKPIPTGGNEILHQIERELALGSNETFDFGTIKLAKVFTENIRKPAQASVMPVPAPENTAKTDTPADSHIAGRIVDEDGKPVAGTTIKAMPTRAFKIDKNFQKTDENGRFHISCNGKGDVLIRPYADDYAGRAVTVEKRGDIGDIVLRRGIRPTVRVFDLDGKPVPNINVTLWQNNTSLEEYREGRTDAEGRFTFQPIMPDESFPYLVTAQTTSDEQAGGLRKDVSDPRPRGAFVNKRVKILEDTKEFELRPVEVVSVTVRMPGKVDDRNRPWFNRGPNSDPPPFDEFGYWGSWFAQWKPLGNDTYRADTVPRGLPIVLMYRSDTDLAYRLTVNGREPARPIVFGGAEVGALDVDSEITVTAHEPTHVSVRLVDENGDAATAWVCGYYPGEPKPYSLEFVDGEPRIREDIFYMIRSMEKLGAKSTASFLHFGFKLDEKNGSYRSVGMDPDRKTMIIAFDRDGRIGYVNTQGKAGEEQRFTITLKGPVNK